MSHLQGGCDAEGSYFCGTACVLCPVGELVHLQQPPRSVGQSHMSPRGQTVERDYRGFPKPLEVVPGLVSAYDHGAWLDLAARASDRVAEGVEP